ncbi:MAG TPA: radical SAM protein, partial [Coriobacteriia bacterium]|nr:radical SAM protein [Coriobacteriia bacterium]
TLDLTTDIEPWWLAFRILRMQPTIAAFSVACWNAPAVYEACRMVKSAAPEITIILGGPEVTANAEQVLESNPAVDMVVRGEGEVTFAELLRAMLSGKRTWMCKGVTARNGTEIVSAPDRPLLDDLDSIPSPYLTGLLVPTSTLSYIETFRGCPHRCAYCFEAKGSTQIRSFSEERVVAEIDALAPQVESFSFIDSVFNLTPSRLHWLADALEPHAARGLRLHTIEVDMERIGDAEAAELKRAGVVSVETGPQSVGTDALRISRREFSPERFIEGVRALKAVGIAVECDLIIGLPGDDAFDVIRGLRWVLNRDPGILQSSTLRVLPGTSLCTDSEELGLCYESEPEHAVIKTRELSFTDIRRLEVMAGALQSSYRARIDNRRLPVR